MRATKVALDRTDRVKKSAANQAPIVFPPWGWMPQDFLDDLAGMADPPPSFRNLDGTSMDRAQWQAWLEGLADELAGFLWPRYDPQGFGDRWSGVTALCEPLTRADLQAMPELVQWRDKTVSSISAATHEQLFRAEDHAPPSAATLLHYMPNPPEFLMQDFDGPLRAGGRMADSVSLQLKHRMQRPRPYQMALVLAPSTPFRYLVANSATTPSLVSGHCIQASAALVHLVMHHEKQRRRALGVETLSALQQLLMDNGDRRVFAGVHYPSDNLSSWFCVFRMIPHCYFDDAGDAAETQRLQQRARDVLWGAITSRSRVHAAMLTASNRAGHPYEIPLQRLREAAV